MEEKKYSSPYLAGVGIGLALLAAFFISGRGLGASGAINGIVVFFTKLVSPEHVNANPYLAEYGGGSINPLKNWLIFEMIGVIMGAMISGVLAGRMKVETNHGPRISSKQRWIFAVIGGAFFGFGARMARGCTSGVALTGGATLAVGSWVTMLAIFIGAYAMAWFVRKLWI